MKQDSEHDMQDWYGWIFVINHGIMVHESGVFLHWHGMAWGTRAEHHLLPIGRLQSSTGHALHLLAQWPYRGVGLREKNMDKYMDNTWQRYSKIMKYIYIYYNIYIYMCVCVKTSENRMPVVSYVHRVCHAHVKPLTPASDDLDDLAVRPCCVWPSRRIRPNWPVAVEIPQWGSGISTRSCPSTPAKARLGKKWEKWGKMAEPRENSWSW